MAARHLEGQLWSTRGKKILSTLLRHLGALQATRVWASGNDEQQRIMLAAGGPGVGTTWTAIARREDEFIQDAQFVVATKARHAQLKVPAGATCRILDTKDNACGDALCVVQRGVGSAASHVTTCKKGPARQRPHRALLTELAQLARQAGADVDKERHVPELYKLLNADDVAAGRAAPKYEEAILDVVVRAPTATHTWW